MNVYISRLSLITSQGLMDHDPRMGQAEAFARGAAGQQQRSHAGRLADTHGADIRLDKLHGIVNGQACGD